MKPTPSARQPVRYHLRVCLTPEHHAKEERALWRVIRAARIDEVMFFVPHAEERSPGLGTNAENEATARMLAPIFARLRKAGVAPSINVWWTVSFSEFPGLRRDLRDRFRFRWAVGVDGRESISAACPACPTWRAHVRRLYETYARLKPVRIWIDDDVRMTMRADLHSACFCDCCLGEMARRTGRASWTRPDLLKGIMADAPNPVRDQWLDYQRVLELEIVGSVARAVHAISPDTSVSLMHSTPDIHAAEGRRWAELREALGTPAPTFRPGIGPYVEGNGSGVAAAFNGARLGQAVLPPGTAIAPEIENYPHSRFNKSAALVRADLELAQLIGAREMTFSIYRFGGRIDLEIAREDTWTPVLGAIKPRLQAIADLNIRPEQIDGVSLHWHEEAARHARGVADQPKPVFVYRQRPWDQVLPLMGIATRYGVGALTAFAGEQIECLTPAELDDVFSRGVLLDARAADSLLRMGRGELAGLVSRKPDAAGSLEIITDAAFGGPAGDVINARWTSVNAQFEWMAGARIISRLRGHLDEDRGHGVTLFENRLGGRVIVVPLDSQAGPTMSLGIAFPPLESPSFMCRVRQAQLLASLEWAGQGAPPLVVEDAPLAYPMLARQDGRLVLGVANLMADPIDGLSVRIGSPGFRPRRVRVLGPTGRWLTTGAEITRATRGATRLRIPVHLSYLDVSVLLVE